MNLFHIMGTVLLCSWLGNLWDWRGKNFSVIEREMRWNLRGNLDIF